MNRAGREGYGPATILVFLAIGLFLPATASAGDALFGGDPYRSAEDGPHGPIATRNLSPVHTLRLGYRPSLPQLLRPGEVRLRFDASWANYYANQDGFTWDYDHFWFTPSADFGVDLAGLPVELGLTVRLGHRQESVLAHLIQWWHALFNYVEERDLHPPQRFFARVEGQPVYDNIDWGVGDLELRSKWPLYFDDRGDEFRFGSAATLLLRLPTGEAGRGFAANGVDVGLIVSAAIHHHWFSTSLHLGLLRYAATHTFLLPTRREVPVIVWTFEARATPELAIHADFHLQGSAVTDAPDLLDDTNMEIHAGLSIRLAPGLLLQANVVENTFTFANDLDVAWHIALEWRFTAAP